MFQPLYNTSCPRLSVPTTKPKIQTKRHSTQQNRKTWLGQLEENNQKTRKKTTLKRHKKLIHLHSWEGGHPTYLKVTMPKIEGTTLGIKSNPKKKRRFSSSYTGDFISIYDPILKYYLVSVTLYFQDNDNPQPFPSSINALLLTQ